ncbi:MAG: acyl--CoA ligase [Opitutales bacterium]|nr:acyl--CoA ligase [Opitutales bacterium]
MNPLWNSWTSLVGKEPEKRLIHHPSSGWLKTKELHERCIALANLWETRGMRPRRIMLARMENGPEWLAAFLAAQKLGVCIAAADSGTHDAIIERIAAHTGAAWIYSEGQPVRACLKARVLRKPLCLAKISSGSTGLPKLLLFGADEMIADGRAIIEAMGIAPDDVNYGLIPFGHSYGLGNLVVPLILQGTAIACSTSPLPRLAARDMVENQVSVCPAVPSFFRALAQTELPENGLGRLRLAISAGSPLPAQVAQDFYARYKVAIHNFLGSSETGGIAYDADGQCSMDGSALGKLMPNVRTCNGRDGRLLISGPAVIRHGNRQKMGSDFAFLLGDRGLLDAEGRLQLLGRATALAKIGGRRLDPLEVERAIASLPEVSAVRVTVQTGRLGDRLAAIVECPLSSHKLRESLLKDSLLAEWKIPRKLLCMTSIERDQRGKISKQRVEELLGRR